MKEFDKHIKTEAPVLFGLKKENDLTVPKGYFEKLQHELLEIPSKKNTKVIQFKKRIAYIASIAAILAFVFIGLEKFKHQKELSDFDKSFNQLTAEAFENEILESDNQVDLYIDFTDDISLRNEN